MLEHLSVVAHLRAQFWRDIGQAILLATDLGFIFELDDAVQGIDFIDIKVRDMVWAARGFHAKPEHHVQAVVIDRLDKFKIIASTRIS